ncbi:MAG: CehA/McbA family metallohydrolase [Dehalococcoidia bacterium]|nr:CehA/McbA family metallohydrolase [Dehalococcoidia bacterium]
MATIIDMHLHTTRGASDSGLSPNDLAAEARSRGLSAVHLSEHDRLWDRHQLEEYRHEHADILVANGMEVSTDLGHILALGLREYVGGIRRAETLRRVADEQGAFLVVAHPFRHYFDPVYFRRQGKEPFTMTPEQAARLPVFQLVDGVEVLNGANTLRENLFALRVAQALGKPGTGGSDAHSTQGIGIFCTVVERDVASQEELLAELHAGRFHAAHGLLDGDLQRFTETSLGETAEVPG